MLRHGSVGVDIMVGLDVRVVVGDFLGDGDEGRLVGMVVGWDVGR